MPFDNRDRLEAFQNDVGSIACSRTPAAPGTGTRSPRQQINTISSFVDASNVYGVTNARLGWLRVGSVDGDPTNNAASLLMGALQPAQAVEAGDVRANENVALTAIQTLFAREHKRIAAALPSVLSAEQRFQIARRVFGGEIEYVTYNQFLPTLGVKLDPYRGYSASVNPGVGNEFAVVGYRAHSMVHGEFEPTVPAGTYHRHAVEHGLPGRGHHGRTQSRRHRHVGDPAGRRLRHPGPAHAGGRGADPAEPR